ncbi:MAG: gas vesicle protein, partial [Acidobacteria bacterium]|nr:gas vesicle protein [Acidobacteriota bacterium]
MTAPSIDALGAPNIADRVSLCEALDRVLNKGAVVVGELTISVADID